MEAKICQVQIHIINDSESKLKIGLTREVLDLNLLD